MSEPLTAALAALAAAAVATAVIGGRRDDSDGGRWQTVPRRFDCHKESKQPPSAQVIREVL